MKALRHLGAKSELAQLAFDLTEAPSGDDPFDKREDGWTKVLLHPAA